MYCYFSRNTNTQFSLESEANELCFEDLIMSHESNFFSLKIWKPFNHEFKNTR